MPSIYYGGTVIGATGTVLTSVNSSSAPTFQAPAASSITIAGNSGSTTGNSFTFTGGTSGAVFTMAAGTMTESFNFLSLPTTTSVAGTITNGQIKINGSSVLNTYGTNNLWLAGSGNGTLTVVTAVRNTAIGDGVMNNITTSGANTIIGFESGKALVDGNTNVIMGVQGLELGTSATSNVGIGCAALGQIVTGGNNTGLGHLGGYELTLADTNNLCLGSKGVTGDSNTIRIGTQPAGAAYTRFFAAAINGVTPATAGALVNVTDISGQVGTITNGTAGWVLTSNGVAANPSFQAPAAGGITTLTGGPGSVGSATGSNVTLTGGTSGAVFTGSGSTMTESFNFLALPTTTSTNGQILINSTAAFHQYGTGNHFSGSSAGNFTLTATYNTGIGQLALHALTSGTQNSAVGQNAGAAISSGRYNMCFGTGAGSSITTTDSNVLIGQASGTSLTGGQNTAVGGTTLYNLLGGSYNSVLGQSAGSSLTGTESSNIYLNNTGTVGESNTLRIGAATGTGNQQLNKAVVCGIYNKAVGATAGMVVIDSTDVMGSVPYVPSTAWTPVLNFGGGTTGISYTTQTGTYCRTGGVVTFTCNIVLSNKGSSTGSATITGLPVAAGATTVCALSCSLFTGTADHDPEIELTSSTINWFEVTQTGSAKIAVTDTAFANTTSFTISGSYLV